MMFAGQRFAVLTKKIEKIEITGKDTGLPQQRHQNTGTKQNMTSLHYVESFEWICLSEAPESNDSIQTPPVSAGDLIVSDVLSCVCHAQ